MSLRAELIDDPAGWRALAPPWRDLAERQGTMFLTPEWFSAWVRYQGRSSAPLVVAVRDHHESLVGVLPLALAGRTLRFAGAELGDRFGALAVPGREAEVAARAADALARVGRAAVLDHVDEGASWVPPLLRAWPGRRTRTTLRTDVLPYVSLAEETWGSFVGARSRNFRNQVGRKERNLQRHHGARYRLADDPARIDEDMKLFFALHDARWGGVASPSSLTRRDVQAFHTDLAAAALDRGWLRLWFLEAGGREVAALYSWRVGHRYAYFNAGWEPSWAEASVGLVLLAHTVRSAIEEGAAEYDLLMGGENYKSRFATGERTVETLLVAAPWEPVQVKARCDVGLRRVAAGLPPAVEGRLRTVARPLLRGAGRGRPR